MNYFYDLEGSKFSTSRGHVIWGGDIVSLGQAESDLTRAYLCFRNPEFTRSAFQADEFLSFHNEVGARVSDALASAAERLPADTATAPSPEVLRALTRTLEHQTGMLDPDTFHLSAAWSCVEQWIDCAPALTATPEAAAAWLLGFALAGGTGDARPGAAGVGGGRAVRQPGRGGAAGTVRRG
ncbi:class I tRNA ligase family protein [Streptomyces tricolor]|nr:class I tRNA ligase family protein [Streptomyces tricolor]